MVLVGGEVRRISGARCGGRVRGAAHHLRAHRPAHGMRGGDGHYGLIVMLFVFVMPLLRAVMGTIVVTATGAVAIPTGVVVAPWAIRADRGMITEGDDSTNWIRTPPTGAAEAIFGVPVELTPPLTVPGMIVKSLSAGPLNTDKLRLITPVNVAVSVAETVAVVSRVEMMNDFRLVPAATLTGFVGKATVLSDVTVTLRPLGPALPFRVTVPVTGDPAAIELKFSTNVASVAGTTVRVPVPPLLGAVTVTVVFESTPAGNETAKLAVALPDVTVTEAGTMATAGLLLDKLMTVFAVTAPPFMVMVPVGAVPPPTADVGEKVMVATLGVTISVTVRDVPSREAVITTAVLA